MDDESGLIYLRARYYDPTTGRFLSQDPKPGFVLVPGSQNLYVYSLNRPPELTDPLGTAPSYPTGDPSSPEAAIGTVFAVAATVLLPGVGGRCVGLVTSGAGALTARQIIDRMTWSGQAIGHGARPVGTSDAAVRSAIQQDVVAYMQAHPDQVGRFTQVIQVGGKLLEYRAYVRPDNGLINIGTYFFK